MYNNHAHTQHGPAYGRRSHHPFMQAIHRAPVNIFKTEGGYEMLVFAPGRVKENFSINLQDKQLTISYEPSQGLPRPDWILREYSRGGFERVFTLDETVDATGIRATYTDGVLQVSLPIIPGKEAEKQDIPVN